MAQVKDGITVPQKQKHPIEQFFLKHNPIFDKKENRLRYGEFYTVQ